LTVVRKNIQSEDEPLWYKDAVIYQVHVKAFFDANGDGVGDFRGLTEKLDYLESLGVSAVWVLPFYPSPFKDDGYDISDYLNIHPDYGTLRDFQRLLQEAHRRGIRVITELVVNHTSDQHPWFQRARRAKSGSADRDFYVWSETTEKYKEARIIFKDFEMSNWSLDPLAKQYYWHRFYHHQPDLNYENPQVQQAVIRVMDYWFRMGVDGLRLDAVPYLFEQDGTNCENLPDTHTFLKKLRSHIDSNHTNRMLLAEANQWPEDAAAYFGKGDESHMAFHFPLMPRMFMAIQMEDRFPIIDILAQTPSIPESSQWAIFLRNHDELTLEMVTDEERDYMYRVYARDPKARINLGIRRRLAPLLENDRRKIELMNVLLLSLPGTPVIYYGDEIGMGDNYYLGDRNGVRTPMQWSADRNAGFSRANPQQLYLPIIIDPEYHYEALNVENQEKSQASLLWWMKRMLGVRKQLSALRRGGLEFLSPDNPKVLAFVRTYEGEKVMVVVNLSRHPQLAELDLSACAGCVPEEVFGGNRFPVIRDAAYTLSLSPYGYYLFSLKPEAEAVAVTAKEQVPDLGAVQEWEAVFQGRTRSKLEREILPRYVKTCRWFAGKARRIQSMKMVEIIPLARVGCEAALIVMEIQYTEGLSESYLLPLAFTAGDEGSKLTKAHPGASVARLKVKDTDGVVHDAVFSEAFRRTFLSLIVKRQKLRGLHGELSGMPGKALRKLLSDGQRKADGSQVLKAEQSNTSLVYPNGLILKLYRRLEEGINPDIEIGRMLTEKIAYSNIPPFAGVMEYRKVRSEPVGVAFLQKLVPNEGDAWKYTLDEVARYLERVLSKGADLPAISETSASPLAIGYQGIPLILQELIGAIYLERASLLGRRTAELHLALASETEDPAFTPEPFTTLYQRSLYQSLQGFARRNFQLLRKNLKRLAPGVREEAERLLAREEAILDRFRILLQQKIRAHRIRIHGDYHLGQVLFTGNDFIIIDFEGEPARSLSERRLKRSPLRDVAGMMRSFHYAARSGLIKHALLRPEDLPVLEPWAERWFSYISGTFLRSYLDTVGDHPILPRDSKEMEAMMNVFLLNKAIYELGYELNSRPDWVTIPIKGIESVLEIQESASLLVEIAKSFPSGMINP
jgi:maltose alpha-D-glucosyltransferase / alpha-amylase